MQSNDKFTKAISGHLTEDIPIILSAAILMAALSQVTVPLLPVPVTGQTLGVLLIGIMLGRRRAVAAMLTYLGMGMIGLPVFAGATTGLAVFVGPTGGYLLGFVPAVWVMGFLGEKGCYRKMYTALAALITGHAVIFALGLLWLVHFTGWSHVFAAGLIPFLPGAAVKTLITLTLLPLIRTQG